MVFFFFFLAVWPGYRCSRSARFRIPSLPLVAPDGVLLLALDRCGAPAFSSGRGLSRARRGTDIHGEWSFIANGDRSSRSASGPLVSPPHPVPVVCGRQGCGCPARAADPRAPLAVVRGVLVGASGGRRVVLARITRFVVLLRDPLLSEPGRVAGPLRCTAFPYGVCTRLSSANLAVLLERSGL